MSIKVKIAAFSFWLVGTGLYLASMLTNSWVTNAGRTSGLFQQCLNEKGDPNFCKNFGWSIDKNGLGLLTIFIPRILMLIGAGLIVVGVLIGLFGFCVKSSAPWIVEGALDIVGGLVIMVACAIFTAKNHGNSEFFDSVIVFSYSFYFGWISGLLYFIAGICGIVAGKCRSYHA